MIRKNNLQAWAAATALLLTLTATTARADNGDTWEAPGIVTNDYGDVNCLFKVVNEAKATVEFAARSETDNTMAEKNVGDRFWMYDEVTHDGKTYSIVGIGNHAFANMNGIVEVSLMSKDVTYIGDSAFYNSPDLWTVNLPEGLTTISRASFMNCTSLRCTMTNYTENDGLLLPESLTEISIQAFKGCTNIQKLHLPSKLRSLQNLAFWGATSLTEVHMPSYIYVFGNRVFYQCNSLQNFDVYQVEGGTKDNIYSYDGVIYMKEIHGDKTYIGLKCIPGGRTGHFVIDDRANRIWEQGGCSENIASVFIPNSVEVVGEYAFSGCPKLKSVYVEWYKQMPELEKETMGSYGQNRTLYIPDEAPGKSAEQLYNMYKNNEFATWFEHIERYQPTVAGLRVADCPVPRLSSNGFSTGFREGSASYDVQTRTLTLNNAVIETYTNDEYAILNEGVEGLTINVVGQNIIDDYAAGIVLYKPTTIEGSGSLSVYSTYEEAIFLRNADLTIRHTDVTLKGGGGALYGRDEANVTIRDSRVVMLPTGNESTTTVTGITNLELITAHYVTPVFAKFLASKGSVTTWDNKDITGYVTIAPGYAYDLYLGDIITPENEDDIDNAYTSNGRAWYNHSTHTLNLDNMNVTANESVLMSRVPDLTINLIGNNYLNATEDAVWLLGDATFTGTGTLTVESDDGCAIKMDNDFVNLTFDRTNATLYGGRGAIYGDHNMYGQKVKVVGSSLDLSASSHTIIARYLNAFDLSGCQFESDNFYYDSYYEAICSQDDYGDPAFYGHILISPSEWTTAIEQPAIQELPTDDAPVYDLLGRRVTGHPQPGILIQKGRKYVQR